MFKTFMENDIVSTRTLLHEAIPITGSIVSGTYFDANASAADNETNIKNYSHGLFQSVYDYPYLSSSANHIFDLTVGYANSSPLSGTDGTRVQQTDKINIYNQMAQVLAGHDLNGNIRMFDRDGDLADSGLEKVKKMDSVFFMNFSRLLVKDEIKKGSFKLQMITGSADSDPAKNRKDHASVGTATATLQAVSATVAQYDGGTLTITNAAGTSKTYVFDDDNTDATGTLESSTNNVYIQINGLSSASTIAAQIKAAIEHANGHNGTITVTVSSGPAANDTLTLTQTSGGGGNRTITRTMTFGGTADDVYTVSSAFTGGTNVNLEGQIVEPGTTSTDYSAKSFVRVGHDNLPNASPDGFYANDGRFFGGAQAATTGLIDAQIEWPRPTLRVNASDGNLSDKTEAFFGVDTTEQGAKLTFDKSYKDLLYPLPASLDSFDVDQSSTTHTEYGYIFTLDDVSGSHDLSEYTWVSGSRGTGKSVTAKSGSYEKILDAGYDRFTTCFHGGFDGYDIREKEPLINHRGTISATGGGNALTSDATETNSYAFYSLKKAIDMIADPEYVPMNLATVPGVTNNPLTSHLMNVCEDRSDSLAIIDLDGGYTHAWDDNTTEQSRISTSEVNTVVTTLRDRGINTSYGCAYYPWVRISDNINGSSVWVPPSVVALGVMGSSESISAPWFAPAGFNRGGLSEGAAGIPVTAVRTKLTSKDRDTLYEANINPIASFPAEGIVVFGQKTLQITQSALDRINVRRLLIFVKREISFMATRVLFDQNEAVTWSRFINMVTPFLDSVKTKFGIQEYRLILDETTTTPDLIDRNVLYAKIFLKPTRAIEFIALDFSIMSTGAAFED